MYTDFLSHFSAIQDPRSDKNKLYGLEGILLLCVCAVVGGAEGWEGIYTFGGTKLAWLCQFLPSADCPWAG